MKKTIILLAVIVVAFIGFLVFQRGNNQVVSPTASPSISPTATSSPTATPSTTAKASPTPSSVASVKTFTVGAQNFSFTLSQITVNKGDTVKIIFQNVEGSHNWVIDEFNARTNVISGGQTQTIQFVANKSGTFEYYCSVGAHRQLGMRGNLIVK
jgi:nitrite reductase (NO-forming)